MLNTEENKTIANCRFIGWGLLGLSILVNVAMAHHPYITLPDPRAQIEQMAQIAPLTGYVHGLLILVIVAYIWLFTFYGAVKNMPFVWLGSGLFALGGLALAGAALISGFLSPTMMLSADLNTPEQLAIFEFQSRLMWQSNQVLAKAGTFAWLCALMSWGGNMIRDSKPARWVGSAGLLIGGVCLLGIITGKWRLDVAGMGLMALIITAWFCALAGCLLWGTRNRRKQS